MVTDATLTPAESERVTRSIASLERVSAWLDGKVDAWAIETLGHVLADLRSLPREKSQSP